MHQDIRTTRRGCEISVSIKYLRGLSKGENTHEGVIGEPATKFEREDGRLRAKSIRTLEESVLLLFFSEWINFHKF